jgi:glycosyltransferase involved in cell wall biosynthesis
VGGISDLLENEKDALIVESGDAQGMADAILRILKDARLAGQLSMNGRNLAEQSGWKIVKPQWELVFQNCLLR